jgi:hypothetical protein
LREEVRVLKEALAAATGKTGIELNAEQRRRLAPTTISASSRRFARAAPEQQRGKAPTQR